MYWPSLAAVALTIGRAVSKWRTSYFGLRAPGTLLL